jgi:hypothetical protein
MRRSRVGGEDDRPMSSEPASSPSLSPAKGLLSVVREEAKGSVVWVVVVEGLVVASMPGDV